MIVSDRLARWAETTLAAYDAGVITRSTVAVLLVTAIHQAAGKAPSAKEIAKAVGFASATVAILRQHATNRSVLGPDGWFVGDQSDEVDPVARAAVESGVEAVRQLAWDLQRCA